MPELVVATMTLARSAAEEQLLAHSLRSLGARGMPVIAADGGSSPQFRARLEEISNLQVLEVPPGSGPRLVGQVQAALARALELGPRYVLYTEPDKRQFFETSLPQFLDEDPAAAGVVVAARDRESFASFPAGQQLTERLLNELVAEAISIQGDVLYGPLLIRSDLIPPLLKIQEDVGWGWRVALLALCVRRGLPVALREMSLPCPPDQQGEDDLPSRLYRMEQLAQNVRGLALGLRLGSEESQQAD